MNQATRAELDRQRQTIGRAFVRIAQQTLSDRNCEQALREAATGALLADDLDFTLVPQLLGIAARAIPQTDGLIAFRLVCGR